MCNHQLRYVVHVLSHIQLNYRKIDVISSFLSFWVRAAVRADYQTYPENKANTDGGRETA